MYGTHGTVLWGHLVLLPLQAGMHQAQGEFNQKTKGAYLLMHPRHV